MLCRISFCGLAVLGWAVSACAWSRTTVQKDAWVLPPASDEVKTEAEAVKPRLYRKISRSQIVGHRGDAEVAPENTLPAVKAAFRQGFPVESDVWMTKDGVAIMTHDSYMGKARYGVDGWVTNLNWVGCLDAADAGGWKGEAWKGTPFMRLDDILAQLDSKSCLFLDVKGGKDVDKAVCAAIAKHTNVNPGNLVILSGGWLKGRLPKYMDFKGGLTRKGPRITDEPKDVFEEAKRLNPEKIAAWNLRWDEELVTKELIDFVHKRGMKVCIWTINDAPSAWAAFGRGADWVCTDRPSSLWKEMHNLKTSKKGTK